MHTPKNIIFIGPQGSGKGTQAKILVKKIGAEYIETGAMLRAIAHLDSDFGHHVRELIDNGKMVTDEDIEAILSNRLTIVHKNTPLVFDGVPRRIKQAEFIINMLHSLKRDQVTTLYFDLPHDLSIQRLTNRRICIVCGRTTVFNGNPNQICEKCGGAVVRRKDDTPEFIRHRLETYDTETVPVIDYLKSKTEFHQIDASKDIATIAAKIEEILGVQGAKVLNNERIDKE